MKINTNIETKELTKKSSLINLKDNKSLLFMNINGKESSLISFKTGLNGTASVSIPISCDSETNNTIQFKDSKEAQNYISLFDDFEQDKIKIWNEDSDYITLTSDELETEIEVYFDSEFKIKNYNYVNEFETTVTKNEFKKTLNTLKKFTGSSDCQHPIITGIKVELYNDKVRLVSMDGYKIHIEEFKGNMIKGLNDEDNVSFVINQASLNALIKVLNNIKQLDSVVFKKGIDEEKRISPYQVILKGDGEEITVNGIANYDNYFEYDQVIPKKVKTTFKADCKKLKKTLTTIKRIVNSENKLVRLDIKDQKIMLSTNNHVSKILTECTDIEGNNLITGFNNNYLIDALSNFDSELQINLSDQVAPIEIFPLKNEEKFKNYSLVLPIRLLQ